MPDKKSTKPQHPEVKISIEGNLTGNIVVGSENKVSQPPAHTNSPRNLAIAGITTIVLVVFLFVAWKVYSYTSNRSKQPDAHGAAETNPALSTMTPLPPGAWNIELFDNINLNGSPIDSFTQTAETNSENGYQISITPQSLRQQSSKLPANNYSLRLAGTFEFQEGYYEFHCEHHDGCRIFVDGRSWIDAWWDGGGRHDLARDLSAGKRVVVIEFYDKSGYGLLEVYWRLKP